MKNKIIDFLKSIHLIYDNNSDTKSIPVIDKNQIEQEGRNKFLEIFREVTETRNKKIEEFISTFKVPSEQQLDYIKRCNLRVSDEKNGFYEQYLKAQKFQDLRNKYPDLHLLTDRGIDEFRKVMLKQYNLNVVRVNLHENRVLLTPQAVNDMMEFSNKIDSSDYDFYLQYKWSFRSFTFEKTPDDLGKHLDLSTYFYGEVRNLSKEERDIVNPLYSQSSSIDQVACGRFIILRDQEDPIVLAELKGDVYVLVSHMPQAPKEISFSV
jgi:hypothetical protein